MAGGRLHSCAWQAMLAVVGTLAGPGAGTPPCGLSMYLRLSALWVGRLLIW